MPSMITNMASPDASGDPDPGIVEDYKARLQALGYSPGLTGKCILPLWKETRRALRDWLALRPESADRHLFLNAMGTGMTRRGFAKRLVLHAQTAARSVPSISKKTVSPHLLHHACAIHTLEATGDVRKVSLWLGHASLQTTEMYLQADPTDKRDTLDKWRPPSLKKGKFKGVQDELLAMLAGT